MFFSSKGVTKDAGLLESNEEECGVKQRMIKNCKERYFLCDKSKIGQVGFVKFAPLEMLDYIITEAEFDDKWKTSLEEHKIETIKI